MWGAIAPSLGGTNLYSQVFSLLSLTRCCVIDLELLWEHTIERTVPIARIPRKPVIVGVLEGTPVFAELWQIAPVRKGLR